MTKRRQYLKISGCVAAAALLCGCSSGGSFGYREYGQVVEQAFAATFHKNSVTFLTASAIPYASMGYRVDGGDQRVLVLATDNDGDQIWTASTHVVFQTTNGRITRTVGLPHDLGGMSPQKGDVLTPLSTALQAPFASTRMADFPDLSTYSTTITCNAAARGPESIAILGQTIATMRVDEQCESRALKWRFVDSYWLDPKSGLAWRSLQHIGPQGEIVETEVFRAPG